MVVVPNSLSLVGFLFIVSAAIFVPSCMRAAGDNVLFEGQTLKTNQSLVSGSLSMAMQANYNIANYNNVLFEGQTLKSNQSIVSGSLSMVMQANCNLVIYNDTTELWSTGTAGKGGQCYVTLHKNGNLVLYSSTANQLWESNSSSTRIGSTGYILLLQKDGNAAIFGNDGFCRYLWYEGCRLVFEQLPPISTEPTKLSVGAGAEQREFLYTDETLQTGESLVWRNRRLTMEKECKLVIYDSNKQLWNWNLGIKGFTGCVLECDSRGNAIMYDRDGIEAWSSSEYMHPQGRYVLGLWAHGVIGSFGPDRWMTHRDGLTRMPSEKTSMVKNE